MELCAGPNCGKAAFLADYAEQIAPQGVTVKRVGCMRLCGKGPNLRWDGRLYHQADKALIQRLMAAGKAGDTPAAVISGGNSKNPACVRGTLETIAQAARAQQVQPPAIIVIGEVAAMELNP